ncbi:MAG: hypothetical protein CMA21_02635 [Euryarchaeota archaeon]|nr:hypothetical protein [Euryarchaeota archaeon]|tara:strand:- start:1101 stop:1616 length:516 start_codon:yes stop_codon:yes gene_type:complete
MADSEWMNSLTRPSKALSAALTLLGSWIVFLTVVNVVIGAYSEGRKVLWIDFLTGVRESSTTDMAFVTDDILFGLIGLAIIGLGARGMNTTHESGFVGWLRGLPKCVVGSLFSSEGGTNHLISSWLVALGVIFYVVWSMNENTWVDPGVYSVAVVLISFGVGMGLLESSSN